VRRFLEQVGWSFTSRIVAAVLQLVVIVLLARGLAPGEFGLVATANVVMMGVVPLNGFGLLRQLQFKRSLDPDDPLLPAIFSLWQRFMLGSVVLWLAGCLGLWLATGDELYVALTPVALWLLFEQQTTVWNAVSIIDGRARELMTSYLWRRGPVVAALAVALAVDLDVVWTWSVSLAVGAALAYVLGRHRAPVWARAALPGKRVPGDVRFDLGFWLSEVGGVLRDFDVAAVTLVSAATGGVYALPARLVRPMNLVTNAVTSVLYPRIARADVITRRQLVLGSVAGTAPVALVSGVVALLAGLLPHLVGDEYAGSVPVLRVLCLCATLVGFGTLLVTVCQARSTAATRFTGRLLLLVAVVQVAAAGVAASVGGATDVAWTVTAITAAGCAIIFARALRECGVPRSDPTAGTPPESGAPVGHASSPPGPAG
jgi:O-antigen/teichoic acid export membrane protein